jgi:magnesium transporter
MATTRQQQPSANSLVNRLAQELIRLEPTRAAVALERLPANSSAALLEGVPPVQAAAVVSNMSPHGAVAVLESLPAPAAAAVIEGLDQDIASRVVRRLSEERRDAVLKHLPERAARPLQTLLEFSENTAGALMDPDVLAVSQDLTVEEARAKIRAMPDQARYNLYVVGSEQKLVGVVNLRELLLARGDAMVADVMIRDPLRLEAHADRSVVVAHPGWKQVHSIPVVDDRGCYLGAVRYRTLRQLEDVLLGRTEADTEAAEALGELFAAGASGLLDALTGPVAKRSTE